MNKVTLIGHLGDAPTMGTTTNTGTPVAKFSLATNERFRDRNGDYHDRSDWHRITAFNGLAQTLARLQKGDLVAVHGRLRVDNVERDGEKRTYVTVVASEVRFLKLKDKPRPEDEPVADPHGEPTRGDDDDIPF